MTMLQPIWENILDEAENYNHKVVSVEYLRDEPVYCFQVESTHCFPLSCGIISQNSGSVGTGKTFTASIGLLYDLCRMLCLEDPHAYFKLAPSTKITFSLINASQTLAQEVILDPILEMIHDIPFFKALINVRRKKKSSTETLFPNRIDLMMGSRSTQTMGRAIVSSILDEANFQTVVKEQAAKNYSSILRRIESRFVGSGGVLPCHMWLCSSKGQESDWLQQHIEEVMQNPLAMNHTKICDYPIWEALKDREGLYDGTTFQVFIGDKIRDPFIVESHSDLSGIDESFLLDVPTLYRHQFELDIFGALQEIAGRGTWSVKKFLPSNELIEEALLRENPVTKVEIQLDFYDESDQLINYLLYHLIERSSSPRFIHFDLSTVECLTGICSTRFDGMVTVQRYDTETHQYTTMKEPIFYTDFMIAVKAKPGQAVPLPKMKEFVRSLLQRKYPIASVSTDGYQSDYFRQELTMIGLDAQLVSLDRTKDPHNHMKNVILESRLNCVNHPILSRELKNLIENPKKIDHPAERGHSKDCVDALSGSMWNAYQQKDKQHGFLYAPDAYLKAIEKFSVGGFDQSDEVFTLEKLFAGRL